MAKTREEKNEALRNILKERYTRMALSFENETDADIIEHLAKVKQTEKLTDYIRRLIRDDMAKGEQK